MNCIILVEVTAVPGAPDHVAITCSPNYADLPPGTLRSTVEAMHAAVVNAPGWKQTIDQRKPLRLTTDESP